MTERLFEQALGITSPWYVKGVTFDNTAGELTIEIDFARGSRFEVPGEEGSHPVYDTEERLYRHMNFFQHRCDLVVRLPRVELPDVRTRTVEVSWEGKLRGFTLLMEAYVFMLVANGMTFAEASRISGVTPYQAKAIAVTYTEAAIEEQDLSEVTSLAIDETSISRGHEYITVAADAAERRVIDIQSGRASTTMEAVAATIEARGGSAAAIQDVCMDMWPAYLKGAREYLPNAMVTIDKYHVMHHANGALDKTRRVEQRKEKNLKGLRWVLVKGKEHLTAAERMKLSRAVRYPERSRTARAYKYKEELREILTRKQPNVVRQQLAQWCTRVMRSKVVAMKPVAGMIRRHIDAIVNWTRSRITNGFLESLHSKFQAAKRKAHGYRDFRTIRADYFLLAGKLNFKSLPLQLHSTHPSFR